MNGFPEIATERLILRGPMDKDLDHIFDVHTDPEVMRYYGVLPYDSEEKAQSLLDWLRTLHSENKGLRWVITIPNDDTYIGDVGFDKYEQKHHKAELGYILSRKHWGRGIMTEAIHAVLEYGFTVMGLNRVQALIDPRNIASKRAAEKNGFQYEGTLRDYELEYGMYIDLDLYSVLARDLGK